MWLQHPLSHILRKKKASVKFITSQALNTDLTTYTFSGVSIGKPDPSRLIVVAAHAEDAAITFTLNSGTVGGVASTLVRSGAPSATIVSGLLQTAYPAQETADIGVTWSEQVTSCAIGVYALYNLKSQTVRHTKEDTGTGVLSVSLQDVDYVSAQEGMIYIGASSNVGGETCTHDTADPGFPLFVENYDADSAELGYSGYSAISVDYSAVLTGGGSNLRTSWSGTGNGDLVLGVWR